MKELEELFKLGLLKRESNGKIVLTKEGEELRSLFEAKRREPTGAGSKKVTKIIKRDGRVELFDPKRPGECIWKAAEAVGGRDREKAMRLGEEVVRIVNERFDDEHPPTVEDVQDIIEEVLIKHGHDRVALAYHDYRRRHEELRRLRSSVFDVAKMVLDYIGGADWRVRENANIQKSLTAMMFNSAGAVNARVLLDKFYPPEIADAHISCDLHCHDLYQGLQGYCSGWSVENLLLRGFVGPPGTVTSRPAKHLSVALQQMVNFIGVMTGEWAGAQAFNWPNIYLAPFVHYDGLEYGQVKQLVEEFVYSLNVGSRWGGQSPFSNITLWIGERLPEQVASKPAIIGGRPMDRTYEEFKEEADLITKAFLEVLLKGDAAGRPFTFPIPTFSITKDFPWDEGLSKLLFELAARYGLPYFQNFVNSDLNPGDCFSMCCRLSLDLRQLRRNLTGGLFGAADQTGSVGVVTINLPRIGYLSKGDEGEFFRRLEYLTLLASKALEHKREIVQANIDHGLLPYTKIYLGNLDGHFSTIGLVGAHEALLNMGIEGGIVSEEGRRFAIRILEFMRKRCMEFQERTGHLYNLEATPAEGVSYRFAKHDRERYPEIITAGKEVPFYTNSTQLPVDHKLGLAEALRHQEPLQSLYTGGTVFHTFLGQSPSPEVAAWLVRRMCENFRIPYYSLTPTYSVCPNHGYITGRHWKCPSCGSDCEVYSRVVGYYRPVQNWNDGKREEFRLRSTFEPEAGWDGA